MVAVAPPVTRPTMSSETWVPEREDAIVGAALLAVLVGLSLPVLLNAAGMHSDAAVVGLQAMHLLHGEHAAFLWGSGYQTSVDSWVVAAFFRLFGATPTALMLAPFVGYVALVGFAYATSRRRFDARSTAVLVSPLVLIAGPMHVYVFYPPRQASLTLLFAAIWVIDGAPASRRTALRLGVGAFVAGLATFADPYCLLFMPVLALLVGLIARDLERWRFPAHSLAAGFAGLALGLVPFFVLSHSRGATRAVYGFTKTVLSHNFKLLETVCLPFLLGDRVSSFSPERGAAWWQPPTWFHAFQILGAGVLVVGIVLGGLAVFARGTPAGMRRLGVAGALMLPLTLGAFLFSVMAIDRWSARYLVSILLFAPFALGPLVRLAGAGQVALLLAPYLVSTAIGGWIGNGSNVDGWRIRRDNGIARDETALGAFCRDRGIRYGLADYWVAYRLTFLFHENPTLIPWHATLDRYPPYRREVDAEPALAYVYDPLRSKETLARREAEFRSGKTDFDPDFEETRVGRYSVLVLHRRHADKLRIAGARPATRPASRSL